MPSSVRRCSHCRETGHIRNLCPVLHAAAAAARHAAARESAAHRVEEMQLALERDRERAVFGAQSFQAQILALRDTLSSLQESVRELRAQLTELRSDYDSHVDDHALSR